LVGEPRNGPRARSPVRGSLRCFWAWLSPEVLGPSDHGVYDERAVGGVETPIS
jgi:hypothetical protein